MYTEAGDGWILCSSIGGSGSTFLLLFAQSRISILCQQVCGTFTNDFILYDIQSRPVRWGGSGGSKEPPFLTKRSTIFNDKLQKILLQTLNFHFKTKFGEKIGRENGLFLNSIH